MKVINSLLGWYLRRRLPRLQRYWQNPQLVQNEQLMSLIHTAQNTIWGQEHLFSKIKTVADFQRQVPISTYENLQPLFQKMLNGQANLLWPGLVGQFSKSAGTTAGASKFIPVSTPNLKNCHLKGTLDTSAWWYHLQPKTRWFADGKGLIMGGSWQYHENSKIIVGDVSALLMQFMPFYAKWFQTPNLATALLPSWEEKLAKMVKICSQEPVTNISGVPTWTLLLFRQMLDLTGKSHILELFPRFEVYMHGGVSFEPYRQQFADLFPSPTVQYREIYNASEGFFAAQIMPQEYEGMLLYLDNNVFFEFLPLSELDKSNPQALTIEQVELNTTYAMVISTNAGLWRYLIGDVVKFSHLYPHHIQIVGRTKQFINVFGEELMVANADAAISTVCKKHNAKIAEYTAAPIYMNNNQKGGHEWLIEFEQSPTNIANFAADLDLQLQTLNSDYAAKRQADLAMLPLVLRVAPAGTFHAWLRSRGKMGGQNKVPRLSNQRDILESILAVI